ncbi:hypothetical protein D3C76_1827560 [compost metagenome]
MHQVHLALGLRLGTAAAHQQTMLTGSLAGDVQVVMLQGVEVHIHDEGAVTLQAVGGKGMELALRFA